MVSESTLRSAHTCGYFRVGLSQRAREKKKTACLTMFAENERTRELSVLRSLYSIMYAIEAMVEVLISFEEYL